jgi:hypothetical protein
MKMRGVGAAEHQQPLYGPGAERGVAREVVGEELVSIIGRPA